MPGPPAPPRKVIAETYLRHQVAGGEFVLRGAQLWQITFNGIQIGGAHRSALDALRGLSRLRELRTIGPDLTGIPDPPADLLHWGRQTARSSGSD